MAKMVEFKNVCANPSKSIENIISKKRDECIQQNKMVIKALMECVMLCGTQGLSLRGHRETSTEDDNKGNFLELVEFRARTDAILASHLQNAPKNAKYTSKNIQNEIISVLGECVRTSILNDIKESRFFSISADEVTDCSNMEQLSIAIRFVDKDCQIREEFIDFVTVERITGNALATAILEHLNVWNLDITNCRGQGYDGASNMSSLRKGVQGRILEVSPLAFYTHCQAHQLSLCVVKACSVAPIRNSTSTVSEIAKLFSFSPKRQRFLESKILSTVGSINKCKLKDVCKTRWIEHVDSYSIFFEMYPFVIQVMEEISHNTSSEWSWDSESITKANGFLHNITSFQFLVSASIAMRLLSFLRGVTVKLQKRSIDILSGYEQVYSIQKELESFKLNCDQEFHFWFVEISKLALELNITVAVPRIVGRQVYRSNAPADSPEVYYRVLPFLNHILTELQDRFGGVRQKIVKLFSLVPSLLINTEPTSVDEVSQLYHADPPSPLLFTTEYQRWKTKWTRAQADERPDSLQQALLKCDSDMFPNIYVLLQITCTLPVTVCENERSNSQLKLLKTYLRSTMSEERMSALALMKIHRQRTKNINLDAAVAMFANRHPRRMILPFVLNS